MDRVKLVEEINQVMIEGFELDPAQLTPSAKIVDDLELDSLDAIDMLVFLEERMNIKVDVERFRTVVALGDVYDIVEDLLETSKNGQTNE